MLFFRGFAQSEEQLLKCILSENEESYFTFYVEMLLFQEKIFNEIENNGLPDALSKEFSFKCLLVMI